MPINPDSETCSRRVSPDPTKEEGPRYSTHLESLGFSYESAEKAEEMLLTLPNWKDQFLTGKTDSRLKRENKTTLAQGLPDMDVDNRPGRQEGDQGKHKRQSSQALLPVSIPKGNPQQGPRSRSDLTGLRMFEEPAAAGQSGAGGKKEECRPKPQPRSPEQKQSTQQAQQAAQQQSQTFDTMPQQKVEELGKKGGEADRKKPLPYCSN